MVKGLSSKEAIKKWESATKQKACECKIVKLNGFSPPIDKLDASLQILQTCEELSLSTNYIDKLSHLDCLNSLKILSIGRNLLKSLSGIECLGPTLEELWASYNQIEKLKPLSHLKKLRVLYFSNNGVKDIAELKHLIEANNLRHLVLAGNPLQGLLADSYRAKIGEILPQIEVFDGTPIIRPDEDNLETKKAINKLKPGEEPETLVEKVDDSWMLNIFT